jgi:hypothetical protein
VAAAAAPRSGWSTALAVFCVCTVLFLVPRDLFDAETRDVEVWFGFELRGPAAMLTAPLHWAVFAIGAWAAWNRKPWVLPGAAAYAFYVAGSHLVWSELSPNGDGWRVGLAHALMISIPGIALLAAWWSSRERQS